MRTARGRNKMHIAGGRAYAHPTPFPTRLEPTRPSPSLAPLPAAHDDDHADHRARLLP